ncbi:protein FAM76A [Harmonia axyridis]|uniref:protein FAM76A n=1 Tax=Harmonia axyridis TaxID=115357 RepID=UPI001E276004|nr:protein FAM76A [Harmonia axyridis]
MSAPLLFACSRCFTRHPFEELSAGQNLCKECRGSFPVVKCTYCRSEFQQSSKGNTSTICKKCEHNVKSYGKPSACEYCNIIAAFIGNKCQRCTNSELKYGPPVNCEQCKQKCAFDRLDDDKKVDGKLLCWLCTLSFKRALAKTKQGNAERKAHLKMVNHSKSKSKEKPRSSHKRPQRERLDLEKLKANMEQAEQGPSPPKIVKNNAGLRLDLDPNSSDHVIAMTQLKEKIASLQKQISMKDVQLLNKDKMITELKAKHFTSENEMRNKIQKTMKEHEEKIDFMNSKISGLLKEVASLSKTQNKKRVAVSGSAAAAILATENSNSGSGTDSPGLT